MTFNMFTINLKLSGQNSTVLLQKVNRSWTIGDLKQYIITQHRDIKLDNLTLIFSGKELTDELHVKDCDIDQNTTLFGVCMPHIQPDEHNDNMSDKSTPGYSSLHCQIQELNNHLGAEKADTAMILKPRVYVYCSSLCQSVQPGKLRVCCSQCKQGSFIVQQDPTCWEDVLITGRIKGICQTGGCHGSTSKFYFKCNNHPTSDNETAVVLQHIKTNTRQVMCLTCADIRNPVLVFPCIERHTICLECFHDYCLTQLNDRQFVQHDELGYTLPCPNGCENSLITENHHFKILGNEQYARYKQYATEECLLKIGGVLCPTPGCGAGILTESRLVECVKQGHNGCGGVFCRNCKRPYHTGDCDDHYAQDCEQLKRTGYQVDSLRVAQAQLEIQQSEKAIQLITKPCPKCKTPTEKNGGCMHMKCTMSHCKFDWCWVCCTQWNPQCMADHWFDMN